ncbi:hypothetical protein KAI58_02985 [Candidatus Gracilibacteria bacterium]|nr:hypothetical protein [Candidatus Gracilibacteria bacterium]
MWLITTFISALIATLLWYLLKKEYKLDFLSLMLWGATIMILVDHLLGYEGGPFIELETDGLIKSGLLLGLLMLIPVLIMWLIVLFIPNIKNYLKKGGE